MTKLYSATLEIKFKVTRQVRAYSEDEAKEFVLSEHGKLIDQRVTDIKLLNVDQLEGSNYEAE